LVRESDAGFVVVPDQFLTLQRGLVVTLTTQYRFPAIYPFRYFVTDGGLMSYGVFPADLYRRSAHTSIAFCAERSQVTPVQGPTKFELVINLKTAKALGLDVPDVVRLRANEVIE
jgi:putative tryptophan/tyrosine transport system substrate-binding protein